MSDANQDKVISTRWTMVGMLSQTERWTSELERAVALHEAQLIRQRATAEGARKTLTALKALADRAIREHDEKIMLQIISENEALLASTASP